MPTTVHTPQNRHGDAHGGGGSGAVGSDVRGGVGRDAGGPAAAARGRAGGRLADMAPEQRATRGDWLQGIVPKSVDDAYEKMGKVGQGAHGTVYKARERRGTRRVVALKKVVVNTSDSERVRFMAREMVFQQRLDHPNVVRLEGVATSRRSIYLVFEFMDDDLGRVVFRSGQCLTEPQVSSSLPFLSVVRRPCTTTTMTCRRPPYLAMAAVLFTTQSSLALDALLLMCLCPFVFPLLTHPSI